MVIIKQKCEYCGKIFKSEDWRHRKVCSKRCAGLRGNSGQYKKGNKHSAKIEKKRIKAIRANPSYGMYGKKHSKAIKEKMSESSKFPYNYVDGGYRTKISNKQCEVCGETKKKIIIHHKDKNRKNNNVKNLKAVCHGCHTKIHNKLNKKVNKIDWNNKKEVKKYNQKRYKNIERNEDYKKRHREYMRLWRKKRRC